MANVIAVIHLILCLNLAALVLLQDPKNGGAGGVFGGGGANTFLGATGGATFLTKLTRYSAVFFGVTCLVLTLLSRPEQSSVLDSLPAAAAKNSVVPSGPVVPAGPAGPVTAASPAPAGATAPGATVPTSPVSPAGAARGAPVAPAQGERPTK